MPREVKESLVLNSGDLVHTVQDIDVVQKNEKTGMYRTLAHSLPVGTHGLFVRRAEWNNPGFVYVDFELGSNETITSIVHENNIVKAA